MAFACVGVKGPPPTVPNVRWVHIRVRPISVSRLSSKMTPYGTIRILWVERLIPDPALLNMSEFAHLWPVAKRSKPS